LQVTDSIVEPPRARSPDVWREFLADLRAQKLRTSLTVIGIAWGTVAVVVLLAFGVGLERQTVKRFHGLGDRIVILFGGRTTKPFAGFGDGRPIRLRPDDVPLLAGEVHEIEYISPEFITRSARVRRGVRAAAPAVTGIVPAYGLMRNIIAEAGGRFINDRDIAERRRVAVLGNELAKLLFSRRLPWDSKCSWATLRSRWWGDAAQAAELLIPAARPGPDFHPATTHYALFGDRFLNNIVYRARSSELTKPAERGCTRRWAASTGSIPRTRTRSGSGTRASGKPSSATCSSRSTSSSPLSEPLP